MAVKSGFFNSEAGDRLYDAEDINKFFDGVITDGVFSSIGDALDVSPSSGMQLTIGSGKAWFLKAWLENTSDKFLTISTSDVTYDRIDIIAIDFDKSDLVRACDIIIVEGTPAGTPVPPTLIDTATHLQKPLAHILVEANVTVLDAGDITNKIGTVDCPYVAGVTELVVGVDDVTIEIVSNELTVKDLGISTGKLAANVVTQAKMALNSVGGGEIITSAVGQGEIAADAVTSAKIADDAIGSEHIKDNAVGSAHLVPDSVGNSEIQNGSVTDVKLGAQSVGWTQLKDAAITGQKIQDDTINSEHYINKSIDTAHIADNAVDISKIGDRVPQFTRRRGGHSNDWDVAGTNNYTPQKVMTQAGVADIPTVLADATLEVYVAFPIAFTERPIVLVSAGGSNGFNQIKYVVHAWQPSETGFTVFVHNYSTGSITTGNAIWLAIGPTT